ncbi:MAG: hypothetical protein HY699_16125 [Deltaproteobacteria bacterium]|nr:hypothetical protein [Deltaproteobacteria bacterium]
MTAGHVVSNCLAKLRTEAPSGLLGAGGSYRRQAPRHWPDNVLLVPSDVIRRQLGRLLP